MKKLEMTSRVKGILIIILLILILSFCFYCRFELQKFKDTKYNVLDAPTEEIFQSRFLNGEPIPPEMNEIYAVEIGAWGGWMALARFKATDSFVTEMLETDYGYEGTYKEWHCHSSFTDPGFTAEFPEKLDWWKPFNITEKACYHAYTCTVHDEKFLLVDLSNDTIYFYRQNCGLCPSGEPETAPLRPWCENYWNNPITKPQIGQ